MKELFECKRCGEEWEGKQECPLCKDQDLWIRNRVSDSRLSCFVSESNEIEGIHRKPTKGEVSEARRFLELRSVSTQDMERFVHVYQPGVKLRTKQGMNVYVGDHVPSPGGPGIFPRLTEILRMANDGEGPYMVHCEYETLHPFIDGNGRSGRMLWAWQMVTQQKYALNIGFKHMWYYQSLSNYRK